MPSNKLAGAGSRGGRVHQLGCGSLVFGNTLKQYLLLFILVALGLSSAHAAEFPPNEEMNRKTISALIEAGSDLNKRQSLEHHFYCYTADSMRGLLAKGESLGYRITNVGESVYEGRQYWYADLVSDTVLDIVLINQENSRMLRLAHEFNGNYGGWGSSIVE